MKIEIIKDGENPLLMRREVFFTVKHEGATPGRKEVREALIKELRSSPNCIVIDKMKAVYGKKETLGYAKIYQSEARLKEIEREHILKRNWGDT